MLSHLLGTRRWPVGDGQQFALGLVSYSDGCKRSGYTRLEGLYLIEWLVPSIGLSISTCPVMDGSSCHENKHG